MKLDLNDFIFLIGVIFLSVSLCFIVGIYWTGVIAGLFLCFLGYKSNKRGK